MLTRSHEPVRVLVRADASPQIGIGHVMRCLSLADELAERGALVTFATRSPDALIERVQACGHRVVRLGEHDERREANPSLVWDETDQLADAVSSMTLLEKEPDVVVVDHYGLSAPWESYFAGRSRVIAIDDLANRPHDVDVLTDQNWYGPGSTERYQQLVRRGTVQLLGPRYAVLQRPYRRVVREQSAAAPPARIVVSFGGTDPGDEAVKALEAINDPAFESLRVDVVVGSAARVTKRLQALVDGRAQTHLHVAVPSLAPLLASADLALGASGAATWERMATGVPAIVTTVAPHQSGVTAALHDEGVTRWLGTIDETEPATYRGALLDALAGPVGWAPRIVDGFGAGRIAESLIPSPDTDLTIRRLKPADAGAVIGLEAEAGGQTESSGGLLDGPAAWRAGEQSFDRLLASIPSAGLIEASGIPVAMTTTNGDAVWIQRCVSDDRRISAIRSLAMSWPTLRAIE